MEEQALELMSLLGHQDSSKSFRLSDAEIQIIIDSLNYCQSRYDDKSYEIQIIEALLRKLK